MIHNLLYTYNFSVSFDVDRKCVFTGIYGRVHTSLKHCKSFFDKYFETTKILFVMKILKIHKRNFHCGEKDYR